jgi:hypothetical protein
MLFQTVVPGYAVAPTRVEPLASPVVMTILASFSTSSAKPGGSSIPDVSIVLGKTRHK